MKTKMFLKVKKLKIVLLLVWILPHVSFSQGMWGHDKIKVFKTEISAQQVTGDDHFGPKKGNGRQRLISDRLSSSNATEFLGQIILDGELRQPIQLLDINRQNIIPILDEINFDYYINYAIPNILDDQYLNTADEALYQVFRDKMTKPDINVTQRKANLYDPKYIKFRRALEKSRYFFQDETSLVKQSEIARGIKLSVGAEIKAILDSEKANVTANFDAALQSFLNKTVKISGKYYELYYTDEYLSSAQTVLSKVDINTLPTGIAFNDNFKKFYNDSNSDIIAGIAILELSFEYSKTNDFKTALNALITSNVSNAKQINTTEIAAKLQAQFEFIKKLSGGASYQTYINLRYYYAPQLQIGKGGDTNNN